MTELSVSVVSYRTPALLVQCLNALAAQRASVDMDVTVVDNASGDDSAGMVASQFPWVRLVRNQRNAGFGAAHNQVLRGARGRYWLVLNSDAAPVPGAVRSLVDFLDQHPRVAVVGPRLRYPDGTLQSSRRRFPTVATLFVESTQLQRFWPRHPVLRRYYFADRPEDDRPQDVDWVVGACLCVRAAAAAEVGLFDEGFFMYSEELDWCRRFRAAGWRVAYLPSAEVAHLEGGSSRLDLAARDRLFQASKLRYAGKWHGRWVAGALRTYLVAEYVARAAEEGLKLALGSQVPARRTRLRVIGSGLRATLRG
jgi:N-acetylglucosaminyl-diphospho-decaprenol L-rhamnosyltransferase